MRYIYGVLLFFAAAITHWMWSTYVPVFGVAPHVLLVFTIAAASCVSPVAAITFGFFWGFFLDVMAIHLFGGNALIFIFLAYLVAVGKKQMDVSSPLSQIMVVGVVTAAYFVVIAFFGLIFEGRFLLPGWKNAFLAPLFNCLIAPIVFAVVEHFLAERRSSYQ